MRGSAHLLFLLGVLGCDGAAGRVSRAELLASTVEAPGLHCPAGGEAIASGVDRNGDGVLAADEVTATRYLCRLPDPAPIAASRVESQAVAPGTDCPNGGYRIDSGVDANGDGQLEPNEITASRFYCRDPRQSLQVLHTNPQPGCPGDGVRIDSTIEGGTTSSDYLCTPWVTGIAAHGASDCAVLSDGSVRCWQGKATPQTIEGMTNVVQVALNDTGVCALFNGGGLSCTPSVTDAVQVTAGDGEFCAIRADRMIACWSSSSEAPRAIAGVSGATAIAAGATHVCALVAEGAIQCWDGTTGPVWVNGLSGATMLTAGGDTTCALFPREGVLCWKWPLGTDGQFVAGLQRATTLAVAGSGSAGGGCAVVDGAVSCWPGSTPGLSGVEQVSMGAAHACALSESGGVACWGGDGLDSSAPLPVQWHEDGVQ